MIQCALFPIEAPAGSKFPTTRMPMGLLEYVVNFFDADTLHEVSGGVFYV